MTGYGNAEAMYDGKKIAVELRSVNSKLLDVTVKASAQYRELEVEVRRRLAPLQRGKVDVLITVDSAAAQPAVSINGDLFRSYYGYLKELMASVGEATVPVGEILRLPEVVANAKAELTEEEATRALACVENAVQQLVLFREQEGATLMADILQRVALIGELLAQVEPFDKERIELTKARLRQALDEAVGAAAVDANRFEQELIYYLEKLDVTEEKTRLRSHCSYFVQAAQAVGSGRKLGFIAQEMGREINTLGSKANDSNMQRIVISMKDELEKIKEQLLNIL
ncbi:MAG: YicC family protein [Prevotellaceae bacterium]|nr:YicC family protein [Prevotellaceae bacterium]